MNAEISLQKKYKQSITRIFKEMLKLVEDMKADHDYHYRKLYENIPQEYHAIINATNHFDDQKTTWIRKKILDTGNDCLRDFATEMENYSVSFIFK
jgi:hypothetical protein